MSVRPIAGISDALGVRARMLRRVQRALQDLYNDAGYDEVIPPIVDRPETLNAGAGRFLADQTLVFSDPADAGLLAIRPDITPQIARIAATRLQHHDVLKLHYSGPVIHARPDARTGLRHQWQAGVECLGVPGCDGDLEILELAARSMLTAGFEQPVMMLGHMGLIHALVEGSQHEVETWVSHLSRRSPEDIETLLGNDRLDRERGTLLLDLASGVAGIDWLRTHAHSVSLLFEQASDELIRLHALARECLHGQVELVVDAAVLPRFLYHSGMVVQGFAARAAQPLLHGGRYDAMMHSHGRDMPATGFSFDLWSWLDAGAEV
ncbi:MAG: ATP phosphoribosyltransferase regulatory subunit [Zetaproteobacteria bacterium]|nr:MAG: ATP phosphoribosyltransferase regulatory subunit [Zetaproteobacteria bacterium]